jgi:predicted transposase YdaD
LTNIQYIVYLYIINTRLQSTQYRTGGEENGLRKEGYQEGCEEDRQEDRQEGRQEEEIIGHHLVWLA